MRSTKKPSNKVPEEDLELTPSIASGNPPMTGKSVNDYGLITPFAANTDQKPMPSVLNDQLSSPGASLQPPRAIRPQDLQAPVGTRRKSIEINRASTVSAESRLSSSPEASQFQIKFYARDDLSQKPIEIQMTDMSDLSTL